MKISNLSIKSINLQNLNFDFDRYGIYVISGENGSGKTSIIEKILFESSDVEFNIPEHLKSYMKDRGNLFTYIPQNIIGYKISVLEYLTKGNLTVDKNSIYSLMEKFDLANLNLYQNFNELSGGKRLNLQLFLVY